MKKWLSFGNHQQEDEQMGNFYVDLDFVEDYEREDLISYLREYEKQRKKMKAIIDDVDLDKNDKSQKVELKSQTMKSNIEEIKNISMKLGHKRIQSLINDVKLSVSEMEKVNGSLTQEILSLRNVMSSQQNDQSDQLLKILEENEELETKSQVSLNNLNLMKITLEETQVKLNNEFALKEIISAKNQNLEEKIKELKEEMQIMIGKMGEMEQQKENLENQLIDYQQDKGLCVLNNEEPSLESKKVEVLEKELNYYKGQLKYLIRTNVAEEECKEIMDDYYQKKDEDYMNEMTIQDKVRPQQIEEKTQQEKFDKVYDELVQEKRISKDLKEKLNYSKKLLQELSKEIEFLQTKNKSKDKNDKEYKEALEFVNQYDKVLSLCVYVEKFFSDNGEISQ